MVAREQEDSARMGPLNSQESLPNEEANQLSI
jgi:hypothetical protein